MIAECDVFYPLQTKISDWYSVEKPPPPPKQEIQSSLPDVLPNEPQPIPMPITNQNVNSQSPLPPPPPFNLNVQRPFLPTDQEIGVKPEVVVSDPNFNTGSHPGEIYVNGNEKSSKNRKTPAPAHSQQTQHSKYYAFPNYYQHYPLHGRVRLAYLL